MTLCALSRLVYWFSSVSTTDYKLPESGDLAACSLLEPQSLANSRCQITVWWARDGMSAGPGWGCPLETGTRAPSWNPAAPGARPVVSPWQPTDLGAPTLERPGLPASWAHFPHEPVCHHRGEPRGREERGRDRMSQRNAHLGLRGHRSRPRRRGSTGNDWGLGEGREGAPWHPQRDLGPRPPWVAPPVACQLFYVAFLKLRVPKIGPSAAPRKTVDRKRMNAAFY